MLHSILNRRYSEKLRKNDYFCSSVSNYLMKRAIFTIAFLMLTVLTWAQQQDIDTLGLGVEAEAWFTRSDHTDKSRRLALIFNHEKFDIFGSLTFDDPLQVQEGSVLHTVQGDSLWQRKYNLRKEWSGDGYTGKIGMNYHLHPNHHVGVTYLHIHTPAADDPGSHIGSVHINGLHKLDLTEDITWRNGVVKTQQLNAYYRGQLQKTSIALDAEYYSRKENVNTVINADEGAGEIEASNSFRHKRTHVLALTLDLEHTLEHGSLNWGAAYLYTRRLDHHQPSSTQPLEKNNFFYHRFIPYVNHTLEADGWQLSTGLQFDSERHEAFWLPSVALSKTIREAEISLAYQTSVNRPLYNWMTTHVTYQSKYDREVGHAGLKSEYMHDISLKGTWKFIEGSIGYEDLRHAVVQTAYQSEKSPYITYWTHNNLRSLKSAYATLTLSPEIGLWHPTLNVELRRQWLTLHTDYGRKDMNTPLLIASLSNELNLGKGWLAEANFNFRSKGDARNVSYTKCSWTTDLSLSKSFLNDRLDVKVEGDDLFHGLREASRLYDKHTMLQQDMTFNSRHVIVTLRYSFNMTHRSYKGHEAGEAEKSRF